MRSEDVRAFVARDWRVVAESKDEQWLTERRRRGLGWCIEVGEQLRRHAERQRPEWPTAEERTADVETHARVGAALRRVRNLRGR